MNRPTQLAEDHWKYHKILLDCPYLNRLNGAEMERLGKWYIAVFEHGYKHGVEDTEVPRAPDGKFQKKV